MFKSLMVLALTLAGAVFGATINVQVFSIMLNGVQVVTGTATVDTVTSLITAITIVNSAPSGSCTLTVENSSSGNVQSVTVAAGQTKSFSIPKGKQDFTIDSNGNVTGVTGASSQCTW